MIIDEKLIDSFNNQIKILKKLQESVGGAVERADKNIKLLKENVGKNVEDVLVPVRPTQSSPAQGGGGKDYR